MLNWLVSDQKQKKFSFKCTGCGKVHRGAPSFSFEKPNAAQLIPEDEFNDRVYLTPDLCVIDMKDHYIRGNLKVPIHESDEAFEWRVWVKQTKESFHRYVESYGRDQSGEHSYGWLPVDFRAYTNLEAAEKAPILKTNLHWGPSGKRPDIIIFEEETHPLARCQREGIDWDHAVELSMKTMHPRGAQVLTNPV